MARSLEETAFRQYSLLWTQTNIARAEGKIDLFDWSQRRAKLNAALASRLATIADNGKAEAAFERLKGIKP